MNDMAQKIYSRLAFCLFSSMVLSVEQLLRMMCARSMHLMSENAARNQLAPACAQRRSQKVNQATSSLSHSPVKAPVPVRTHCTNA